MCDKLPCLHFKSKDELLKFKKLYIEAINKNQKHFNYKGMIFLTDYSKELIIKHNHLS